MRAREAIKAAVRGARWGYVQSELRVTVRAAHGARDRRM